MNLPNRLTGKSLFPEGAFFFVYDYWIYADDRDAFVSLSDGDLMPEELLRRYLAQV